MVDSQQNVEKSKEGDAEDLSVIAQRFLNIFRQLHVFTSERKQSFDEAILALSPEVRGSFSKLLGGSVLQEYVDELEKKTGNVSARDGFTFSNTAEQANAAAANNAATGIDRGTEQLLAKVLESSQKNAQAAAQAQMQFQAKLIETMKTMPQATSPYAPAIDSSKLEEMVSNLIKSQLTTNIHSSALPSNNTAAIDGSKLEEMVNCLVKSQLASSNQQIRNDSILNSQPFDNERLDSIISKVVKSQAELITDAAKIQTEQLSKAITAGLKESYNHSTQSIIETLKIMNRDSVDALRESFRLYASTQKPIMVSNYNVAGAAPTGIPSGRNYQIAENSQKEIVYNKAPEEFYYETDPVQTPQEQKINNYQALQNSNNDTETLSQNQKKKKKKNKNKNNGDINPQAPFYPNMTTSPKEEDYDVDELSFPENDDISLDALSDIDFSLPSAGDETENYDTQTNSDWNWLDDSTIKTSESSIFEEETSAKEVDFIKTEETRESYGEATDNEDVELEAQIQDTSNAFYEVITEDATSSDVEEEIAGYEYIEEDGEEIEEYVKKEFKETTETYSKDFPNTTFEDIKDEEPTSNTLLSSDALLAALGNESEDELEWDEEENIVENYENELIAENDYSNNTLDIITIEEPTVSADEEEWEYVEEETNEVAEEKTTTFADKETEEEWEYVEVTDDDSEEYEWEYVEEEATTEEKPLQASVDENTEEWEWVEESETEEDIEWEWEYEEVPEDEKTLIDQEPITFEEEYIEPEGEYTKKPSPISSDGIIEQESIFNFSPTTATSEEPILINDSETDEKTIFEEISIKEDDSSNYTYLDEVSSETNIESFEQWQENLATNEPYNIFENSSINEEAIIEDNKPFKFDEELLSSDENLNFEIESLKTEEEAKPDLEDYLTLEDLDSNSFVDQEEGYEKLDIDIDENNDIVEDLETIDIDTIEDDDIIIKPV